MAQHRIPVLETHSWQPPVISIANAPTVSTIGSRFIVGAAPTGDFTGHANKVAWKDAAIWHFDIPEEGWRTYVTAQSTYYYFDGTTWQKATEDGRYINANASSTSGKIPQWDGTTGDLLTAGLDLRTVIRAAGVADDISLATEKAVRDAISALLGANDAMIYKGVIDASGNPNYPAADAGHTYKISVAGKIGGTSGPKVEVGDMIIAINDGTAAGTHATVGANWNIIQVNIDGAVTNAETSVVDGSIAIFDGTSGKVIKSSSLTITALNNHITTVTNHIGDGTLHYTQAQIDHLNILNRGTNTHAQIDTHIAAASIHRDMTYSAGIKAIIYSE